MSLVLEQVARPHLGGPIDLRLAPGRVTVLLGPNGAGKTTLLRAAAGLTSGPGSVRLGSAELASLSRDERARRLAYLPADRTARWPLGVRDTVALGLLRPDPNLVACALARTQTTQFAERRIDTLSTGERARVLLARAIVGAPEVLLLDEPVANLDPLHQLEIMALLRAEAERGAAILVSLHDLALAAAHADDALLLSKGRTHAQGQVREVLRPENIATVFGVRQAGAGWERA